MTRTITADHLASAIRGLRLRSLTRAELADTIAIHSGRDAFGSRVILQAVEDECERRRQLIATAPPELADVYREAVDLLDGV